MRRKCRSNPLFDGISLGLRNRSKAIIIEEMNDRIRSQWARVGSIHSVNPIHPNPKEGKLCSFPLTITLITIVLLLVHITCNHNQTPSVQQSILLDQQRHTISNLEAQNEILNATQKVIVNRFESCVADQKHVLQALNQTEETLRKTHNELTKCKQAEARTLNHSQKIGMDPDKIVPPRQKMDSLPDESEERHLIRYLMFVAAAAIIAVLYWFCVHKTPPSEVESADDGSSNTGNDEIVSNDDTVNDSNTDKVVSDADSFNDLKNDGVNNGDGGFSDLNNDEVNNDDGASSGLKNDEVKNDVDGFNDLNNLGVNRGDGGFSDLNNDEVKRRAGGFIRVNKYDVKRDGGGSNWKILTLNESEFLIATKSGELLKYNAYKEELTHHLALPHLFPRLDAFEVWDSASGVCNQIKYDGCRYSTAYTMEIDPQNNRIFVLYTINEFFRGRPPINKSITSVIDIQSGAMIHQSCTDDKAQEIPCMVNVNGCIHRVSGSHSIWNESTLEWEQIQHSPAPLEFYSSTSCSSCVHVASKNIVLMFGGKNSYTRCSGIWRYCLSLGIWKEMRDYKNHSFRISKFRWHAVLSSDERVVIIAPNRKHSIDASFQVLNIQDDDQYELWKTNKSVPKGTFLMTKSEVSSKSKLLAFGWIRKHVAQYVPMDVSSLISEWCHVETIHCFTKKYNDKKRSSFKVDCQHVLLSDVLSQINYN